jgi:Flp pilus assembly protein TadG
VNIFRRFRSDESGNFGMLTAFALVPLIGTAGMAIDFSRAISLRHDLMGIADAAALGAISEGSKGHKAIQQMTQDGKVTIAQDEGRSLFMAQRAGGNINLSELPLDVTMTVSKTGANINSVASFQVQMPTTFLRVLGKDTITVSGTASAAFGSYGKSYTDFYMLLDNTPSMGIAANTAEIKRMKELTKEATGRACAFACHVGYYDNKGKFIDRNDKTYEVAVANKITLRIDVVAKAAKALIDKIVATASVNDQYRVATYSFGKFALQNGHRIEKVSSLTLDMTSAANATKDVTLMTTNHDWYNHNALTSFDVALTEIGREIKGFGGSGSSAADAEKVVYFVTDGMADHKIQSKCSGSPEGDSGRCLEPINTQYCKALKDRNIKVAVLYTTYVPLDGDGTWDGLIRDKFAHKIAPALQECASPDLFFEVKPDDDMQAAMVKLFVQATGGTTGLRLTH